MSDRTDDTTWTEKPTPEEVREQMQEGEPYTVSDLLDEFDATPRETLQQRLETLAGEGEVRRKQHGSDRVSYWIDPGTASQSGAEWQAQTGQNETDTRARTRQGNRDEALQQALLGSAKDGAIQYRYGPVTHAAGGLLAILFFTGLALVSDAAVALVTGSLVLVPLAIGMFYIAFDLKTD